MKVVHLCSNDIMGGAARAASRIHAALVSAGVDSWMLVQEKYGDDPRVIGPTTNVRKAVGKVRPYLEPMMLKAMGHHPSAAFTPAWLPSTTLSALHRLAPDVVHLHWICNGQLAIRELRNIATPVVWTLHDMWPFTGGCHYTGACAGYKTGCGNCPVLGSHSTHDLSRRICRRKADAYSRMRLTLACPSHWMQQCAGASSLFQRTPSTVVPYALDTTLYSPSDSGAARARLQLPATGHILLLSASDPAGDTRKGARILLHALTQLHTSNPTLAKTLTLAIAGCREGLSLASCPIPIHYLGRMTDDLAIATGYAAADLVVVPSLEDNLPNVAIEALACGRPVVGSAMGGIPDIIEPGVTGILTPAGDPAALATALNECLSNPSRLAAMSLKARVSALARYSPAAVAAQYRELYTTQRRVSAPAGDTCGTDGVHSN